MQQPKMMSLKFRIIQYMRDTKSINLINKINELNCNTRLEKFYSFVFALLFGDGP